MAGDPSDGGQQRGDEHRPEIPVPEERAKQHERVDQQARAHRIPGRRVVPRKFHAEDAGSQVQYGLQKLRRVLPGHEPGGGKVVVEERVAVKAGVNVNQEEEHRGDREAHAPVFLLHRGGRKLHREENLREENQDAENQDHGGELFPGRVSPVFYGVRNL